MDWSSAFVILASGVSYGLYQRSRPITVNDSSGPRVLIRPTAGRCCRCHERRHHHNWLYPPRQTATGCRCAVMLPPLTQGHVLIAGETGSGKSTAMLAVLQRRQQVVAPTRTTPQAAGAVPR